MLDRSFRFSLLILVAGALCISAAPIFAVLAGRWGNVGPTASAFWRMALAVPVFWTWVLLRPSARDAGPPRLHWGWLLIPGVCFAGDMAAWHKSFEYITTANSTLLANVAVIFVALGGVLFFQERYRLVFAIGTALALGGVALLVLSSVDRPDPVSDRPVLGSLLGLLTACFYAAYQLSAKKLRGAHPVGRIMAWVTLVSALLLLPMVFLCDEPLLPDSASGWGALIALALVSQCAGQGCIVYALARLPAGSASVSLLIQPVSTALLGWLFLSQSVVWLQAAGGVIVLVGIYLALRGRVESG